MTNIKDDAGVLSEMIGVKADDLMVIDLDNFYQALEDFVDLFELMFLRFSKDRLLSEDLIMYLQETINDGRKFVENGRLSIERDYEKLKDSGLENLNKVDVLLSQGKDINEITDDDLEAVELPPPSLDDEGETFRGTVIEVVNRRWYESMKDDLVTVVEAVIKDALRHARGTGDENVHDRVLEIDVPMFLERKDEILQFMHDHVEDIEISIQG